MEELYKKYSNLIYKYLLSISKDSLLAEELTQETFYSAIKYSSKIPNDSMVKPWLYKIAKNKWIDHIRKQSNKKIESINENVAISDSDNCIEDYLIEKDELLRFYKSIHNLDELTREVVYLKIKSELSFKEIATILNKSEEWTRVSFYRAKLKLKEGFNDEIRK